MAVVKESHQKNCAIILGEGGALDFILAELKKVDLEPNLKKFQAYTISPAEFQAALSTEQKKWLKRTFIITDPILRSQVEHAETLAGEAKAAAADAPPATKAERELCGDPELGDVGTIARVTAALAERSAHCAHTAIFYSPRSRVDYVFSVHLPSHSSGGGRRRGAARGLRAGARRRHPQPGG